MGIIHYLFIAGQECKTAYLPLALPNVECHILWIYRQWKTCLPKYQCGQKLCKVNKSHPSFSSKLFELIPKSGVTHSPTMKAMALSLLNSPRCFKIHDHVILMVKPSTPKATLSVVIALTGVPSFAFLSNQSAADMAKDNGPSQCNRISFIWVRTFSNCNFVPSL